MSKANPKKAMAALLPPGQAVIRPMTLGVWAALERIDSPLITGKEAKDTLELIPSLYLLTHDPREVFRGNILDLAMQWADTQPVGIVERIKEAAYQQMNAFFGVVPEADEKKKTRSRAMAGSRGCSTGRHARTTGAMKTSCGASRSRRSPSSDARNASARTAPSGSSR